MIDNKDIQEGRIFEMIFAKYGAMGTDFAAANGRLGEIEEAVADLKHVVCNKDPFVSMAALVITAKDAVAEVLDILDALPDFRSGAPASGSRPPDRETK
jgi:hypothetical protein